MFNLKKGIALTVTFVCDGKEEAEKIIERAKDFGLDMMCSADLNTKETYGWSDNKDELECWFLVVDEEKFKGFDGSDLDKIMDGGEDFEPSEEELNDYETYKNSEEEKIKIF